MRLSEIANVLQAPVSSCFQLIRTLQRRGYVYALNGKSYYPTKRMLLATQTIGAHDPLIHVLGDVFTDLRDQTGESVILAQQADNKVMLLEVVESLHTVRYTAKPGALRHLYSSALGKALVSVMSPEEREKWLPPEPYPSFTASTLTTRASLDAELDQGRARGWFSSLGETFDELYSVAMPVRFAGAQFALCVAGPVTRFEPKLAEHGAALVAAARRIEQLSQEYTGGTATSAKALAALPKLAETSDL